MEDSATFAARVLGNIGIFKENIATIWASHDAIYISSSGHGVFAAPLLQTLQTFQNFRDFILISELMCQMINATSMK